MGIKRTAGAVCSDDHKALWINLRPLPKPHCLKAFLALDVEALGLSGELVPDVALINSSESSATFKVLFRGASPAGLQQWPADIGPMVVV